MEKSRSPHKHNLICTRDAPEFIVHRAQLLVSAILSGAPVRVAEGELDGKLVWTIALDLPPHILSAQALTVVPDDCCVAMIIGQLYTEADRVSYAHNPAITGQLELNKGKAEDLRIYETRDKNQTPKG